MPGGGPRPPKLTRYSEQSYEAKVYKADKDFLRSSQEQDEYEFSSPRGGSPRIFKGYYKTRGPYQA